VYVESLLPKGEKCNCVEITCVVLLPLGQSWNQGWAVVVSKEGWDGVGWDEME